MGRLIGLVLFVVAVYVAIQAATGGDETSAPESAGELAEDAGAFPEREEAPRAAPRKPVTARVRDKVQGAVDDRTERIGEY
jgi:hypothetical protein